MLDSTFIALEVHKPTIPVAVAQSDVVARSATGEQFRTARIMSASWWRSCPRQAVGGIFSIKQGLAAMACICFGVHVWMPLRCKDFLTF